MQNPIQPFLDYQGIFIVDGGLATELEWRGYDLSDELWSAKYLLENPAALKQINLDYLQAGADCVTSATYQATLPGLMRRGLSHQEAVDLLIFAIDLACAARDAFWADETNRVNRLRPLVAASIGPYGAYLANGAEYTGAYDLDTAALADWHRERWHILAQSNADLIACETIPSFAEARALYQLLRETPESPAWVSFSCKDGQHISDGTPLAECATLFDNAPNVVSVGVNCTPPRLMPELMTAVQSATRKPIILYPNSGEGYDAQNHCWIGDTDPSEYGTISREWRKMGASLIGGCCRTRPSHIQQIRDRTKPLGHLTVNQMLR